MASHPPPCKAMFGSLAAFGFICLLLVAGSQAIMGEPPAATAKLAAKSGGNFRDDTEAVAGSNKLLHPQWHLNYMSKRRVPNGPDPIHNRRAGNSGRPPGKKA